MRVGPPASKSRLRVRLAPFDLMWAFLAPLVALALRDPGLLDLGDAPTQPPPAYVFALVTAGCALPAFALFRLSEGMSRFFSVRDVVAVCAAVGVAVASSSVILFVLTRLEGVPRSTPVICGLVLIAGLLLARMAARLLHPEEWAAATDATDSPHDSIRRRVLLVGVDRFATIAIKLTESQRPRSTVVVAALDPRPEFTGRMIGGVEIVGDTTDLGATVEEYAVHGVEIDEVWICDGIALAPARRARLVADCSARGLALIDLSAALNLSPAAAPRPALQHYHWPAPRAEMRDYLRLKRALDLFAAASLLILLAPVALVIACVTLLDLGAPVLFWQQRVGMNGRKFLLYKFRTYPALFDGAGARVAGAGRLSFLGSLLRKTRLDEMPQLINVLIGDMSIVGPRPLLPQDQPADPSTRLTMRPGITGWAQINGGTIVTTDEKDALDAWYVRHVSLSLDLRILVSTFRFLLTGEKLNAIAVREAVSFRARALRERGGRAHLVVARPSTPVRKIMP